MRVQIVNLAVWALAAMWSAGCPPLPESGTNACARVRCTAGTHCESQAQGAACVNDARDPKPTCASLRCSEGSRCVDTGNGAECSAEPEAATRCAAAQCPADSYCDDISGHASCIALPSCAGVSCQAGEHCELRDVQCIRAPCPPQPACVTP